jgi:Surface lipoprotein assembly modifier
MAMTLRFCPQRLSFALSVFILVTAAYADAPADSQTQGRTLTLTYGIDVGVAETDNVNLTPTDKVSQTIAQTDVDFAVKEESRRLDLDAKGNFSYLDYLQNAYGGQLIGRFDGTAQIALLPERLTWMLQDDFGQTAVDAFTPTTPNNLEDVNYFSTGPDLALRLGGTSFMNVSARFAHTTYETSPFNSNRVFGSVAWGLDLSARSSVSLNADTEKVMFENTVVNTDFDRTNAFVRYSLQGARTELTADVGGTDIDQNGATTAGALGKIHLSRKMSAAATLTLTVGHQLTDASTVFSNLQSGAIGVIGTAPPAQSAQNYTTNYATVGWQYVRNRTTIGLSGHWEKDTYEEQPSLDYTRGGVEINLQRRLTRSLTAQLVGRYYKINYVNISAAEVNGSPNYNDELIGANLAWHHGRGLEVRLRYSHNAQVTPGTDFGYGENRVLLTIGYRPRVDDGNIDPVT